MKVWLHSWTSYHQIDAHSQFHTCQPGLNLTKSHQISPKHKRNQIQIWHTSSVGMRPGRSEARKWCRIKLLTRRILQEKSYAGCSSFLTKSHQISIISELRLSTAKHESTQRSDCVTHIPDTVYAINSRHRCCFNSPECLTLQLSPNLTKPHQISPNLIIPQTPYRTAFLQRTWHCNTRRRACGRRPRSRDLILSSTVTIILVLRALFTRAKFLTWWN